MSFSSDCKNEIMSHEIENSTFLRAQLRGMLCFFSRIGGNELLLNCENGRLMEYIDTSFRRLGVELPRSCFTSGAKMNTFRCDDPSVIASVFSAAEFPRENILQMELKELYNQETVSYFISGVFLAAGRISEPDKSYHLEFATHRKRFAMELSQCLDTLDTTTGILVRGYNYIVYLKNSGQIEDILTFMGSTDSSMLLMRTKIYKDIKNKVTRRVNCENANAVRAVKASENDRELIQKFYDAGARDSLGEELAQLADIRLNNPELSLNEIVSLMNNGLTKSGVNHRLRKIRETIKAYFENNGN